MTAPSPLVGEGFTDANHKLCWERGWRGAYPSPGSNLLRSFSPPSPTRGEGRTHSGVKNGSGGPSVVLNTTLTFWPILNLSMSQSTKLVSSEGPSLNVT